MVRNPLKDTSDLDSTIGSLENISRDHITDLGLGTGLDPSVRVGSTALADPGREEHLGVLGTPRVSWDDLAGGDLGIPGVQEAGLTGWGCVLDPLGGGCGGEEGDGEEGCFDQAHIFFVGYFLKVGVSFDCLDE